MPLLVGLCATVGLHIAERTLRLIDSTSLPDGYRLQDWASNWTMQTMGLEDMASFGPRALWFDHVYPPLLDSVRYLFMLPETIGGFPPDSMRVDMRLYALYAVLFGVVTSVIYLWIRDLTGNGWLAGAVSLFWAISPGFITVMTLLEPTPPAIAGITIAFYFLYRFLKTRRLGYASAFLAALLVTSLTRNVIQVHVLIVILFAVISFWLISRRRSWLFMTINITLVALIFALPLKQYVLFGSLDVSTHTGYNRSGALWIDPRTVPELEYPREMVDNALVFSSRYNTQVTVMDNYRLGAAANELMVAQPIEAASRLWRSVQITVPEILKPTSKSTQNYFAERLPWRGLFDALLSGWSLLALVAASFVIVCRSRGVKGSGALLRRYGWLVGFWVLVAIPVLFSNRYWPGREDEGPVYTEASRLKALLEIPVLIFVVYAGWLVASRIWHRRKGLSRMDVGVNAG